MFTTLSNLRNLAPSRHVFALSVVPSILLQIFLKKAIPSFPPRTRVAISVITTAVYLQFNSKALAANVVFNIIVMAGLCGAGKCIADSLKPSVKDHSPPSGGTAVDGPALFRKAIRKAITGQA
jgi:hypothetical protein